MAECEYQGVKFTDSDVVDLDDWIPEGEYNPHGVRPWLLHDHGFVLCVVFASCLQDALDKAVDEDKLDRYLIDMESLAEREDYMTKDVAEMAAGFDKDCPEYVDKDGCKWWWSVEPAFLGNASEPFDIESLGYIELPNCKRSFCAQFSESSRPSPPRG
jgi:hypothetical protein